MLLIQSHSKLAKSLESMEHFNPHLKYVLLDLNKYPLETVEIVSNCYSYVPGCLILASGSLEDGTVTNIMGTLSGASSLLNPK